MNFIEAVKALKEDRCKSIRRQGCIYEIVKDKFGILIDSRDLSEVTFNCINILAEDWELVNPKPVYEEVEVVRYLNTITQRVVSSVSEFLDRSNSDWVKLTGTIKREAKPKVKHREEIIKSFSEFEYPFNTKFFAEWED